MDGVKGSDGGKWRQLYLKKKRKKERIGFMKQRALTPKIGFEIPKSWMWR